MATLTRKVSGQLLLISIFLALASMKLYAVQTASWEINNAEGWRRGEMTGAIITPDGNLALGVTSTKIALISKTITDEDTGLWCNIRVVDKLYFGSAKGMIYSLDTKDNKLDEFFNTGEWLVTTMADISGTIYAGTIPNGKIFKIDQTGKGDVFVTLPEASKYVWQLCFDKEGMLYAATGPEGKIYKIDPSGKAEVFYDTKKKNVLSLLYDGADSIYAGTADPGIVYRISLKGRPEILADFGDMEIKSLAYYRDATNKEDLYIGANTAVKVAPPEFLNLIQDSAKKAEKPASPGVTPKSTSSQNPQPSSEEKKPASAGAQPRDEGQEEPVTPTPVVEPTQPPAMITENASAPPPPEVPKPPVHCTVYKLSNTLTKEIITLNDCYITEMQLDKDKNIIVGTDNSGRIYQVQPNGQYFVPYEFDTQQVLTLVMNDDNQLQAAGTGKKAAVFLCRTDLSTQAIFTTEVWDAKFPAKWGVFAFKGQGQITLQTQSGNTAKPDETWSDWSDKITFEAEPAQRDVSINLASPPGRYFRAKIAWTDSGTIIRHITQYYLIHNQQPKILDLKVGLPQQPQPSGIPPRVTMRKINFQAKDPDNDILSFRLFYRREDQKAWVMLNQEQPGGFIMGDEYMWNTEVLPDGIYYFKLEATDERVNAQGTGLKDEKISEPVIIDNTKPQVKEIVISAALECAGRVEDNLSQIVRIEYAVDGGKWDMIFPLDGMLDSKMEEFMFRLPNMATGIHNISFRAFDIFGNMGLEQVEINK